MITTVIRATSRASFNRRFFESRKFVSFQLLLPLSYISSSPNSQFLANSRKKLQVGLGISSNLDLKIFDFKHTHFNYSRSLASMSDHYDPTSGTSYSESESAESTEALINSDDGDVGDDGDILKSGSLNDDSYSSSGGGGNSCSSSISKPKAKLNSEEVAALLKVMSRNSADIPATVITLLKDQLGYMPYNVRDIGYYEGDEGGGNVSISPESSSSSNSSSDSSSNNSSNSSGSNNNSSSSLISRKPKHPAVAVLYPLNFNLRDRGRYSIDEGLRPFPTTFWMTSPSLRANISVLEHAGWITRIDKTLKQSEEYLSQMARAHRCYAEERWGMLSIEDRELVIAKGWEFVLHDVGIAGIREPSTVKCLHCHYSHYLARPSHGNIIGMWVQEIINTGAFQAEVKSC